jgi:3-methyladenine DNA glycosylase AlkD
MKENLRELEKILGAKPVRPSRWKMADYIGAGESQYIYLELRIPEVRAAFKKGFSFPQSFEVWDYVWKNARHFEVMCFAQYFLEKRTPAELLAHDKMLFSWIERVDNWALSDGLSAIYAKMLEANPKYISVFKKWSTSRNPWKRRQSMVGLMCYSRLRKSHPPVKTILALIEAQIDFDHYYVQKGVGWTLRECYNVYPKETLVYLKKNAARLDPGAWYAATEKLIASQKKTLLAIRRSL